MKKIKRFKLMGNSMSIMTSKQMEQIIGCKLIFACTCYCVGNNETGSVIFNNKTGNCPYTVNKYIITPYCPNSLTYCTL